MALIFDFLDYRDYLNAWIDSHPSGGHGLKKQLAEHLNCQGAFVSQVLHKTAHFSMEHGFKVNSFLQHNSEEADYFVLILLYQRAGSEEAREYFRAKIDTVHQQRLVLKNRIKGKTPLSLEDQTRYYSSWHYSAIRLLVGIPGCDTKEKLVSRLKLTPSVVTDALEFLTSRRLLDEKDGHYSSGELHTHLGDDSPLIGKHHTNWRLLALSSLINGKKADLHYSLGITLSKEDAIKIKAQLVEQIAALQKIARPSPAEALCGFCLDWFEVGSQ